MQELEAKIKLFGELRKGLPLPNKNERQADGTVFDYKKVSKYIFPLLDSIFEDLAVVPEEEIQSKSLDRW